MTRTKKRTEQEKELLSIGGYAIYDDDADYMRWALESELRDWIDKLEYLLDHRSNFRSINLELYPEIEAEIDDCFRRIYLLTKVLESLDT